MIITALIGSFVLTKTYFGRYVFALGGNEEAARLAGVNIKRMRVLLFTVCGFASGITSVLLLSRVFAGQVFTGQGIEFDALTAALLGGFGFRRRGGHYFRFDDRYSDHWSVEQCHATGKFPRFLSECCQRGCITRRSGV